MIAYLALAASLANFALHVAMHRSRTRCLKFDLAGGDENREVSSAAGGGLPSTPDAGVANTSRQSIRFRGAKS